MEEITIVFLYNVLLAEQSLSYFGFDPEDKLFLSLAILFF